jgi:hypothetical protein
MHTLIIGDSWATVSPWGHKEYNQEPNYSVNISIMGQGNMNSLKSAYFYLMANERKVDLIVWYFTSLLRDAYLTDHSLSFKEYLDLSSNSIIEFYNKIRKEFPGPKWAIIGGHAPIYDIEKYTWADFIVEDWRSEMVGKKLATNQSLGMYNALDIIKNISPKCTDDIIKELDAEKTILDIGKKNPNIFPDGIHPSHDESVKMCERIINFFKQ